MEKNQEHIDTNDDSSTDTQPVNPVQILEDTLVNPENLTPLDMGMMAGKELERMEDEDVRDKLSVAIPVAGRFKAYTPDDLRKIRQDTTALRTRLNALLQARDETRTRIARSGKVDSRRIGRIACLDTRIFARRSVKQGINTAIHILLDASYSMENGKMELAAKATYALAAALENVAGVNVGVTAFPAPCNYEDASFGVDTPSVAVVKRHGQGMHDKFQVHCCGGTPLPKHYGFYCRKCVC